MVAPSNKSELSRVLGMINYLGRFIPDLSTIINPIYSLLKTDTVWTWEQPQQDAYDKVKQLFFLK